ncbi:MAG: putative glycolipid-binding domain-containing protein [Actinomycetota bacterium]|nr:putative glycolipid-binding domain-containing protein [Actinomycetota bacterium]
MSSYAPFPSAHEPGGHVVRWATWAGDGEEVTTILWENEGFTVSGQVGDAADREHIQYVLRLSASWQVRQFLLFRDLDEPDLWLATDGSGRWGEMNGAHRTELDGCYDIHLDCTPFTHTLPIRRLPLLEGHTAELPVVHVNPDTLEVSVAAHRYTRTAAHAWRFESLADGLTAEIEVDQYGVVRDYPERFRRLPGRDAS